MQGGSQEFESPRLHGEWAGGARSSYHWRSAPAEAGGRQKAYKNQLPLCPFGPVHDDVPCPDPNEQMVHLNK